MTVRELVMERKTLEASELEDVLDLQAMTELGVRGKPSESSRS
jgi:aspartate ammonia-lyase